MPWRDLEGGANLEPAVTQDTRQRSEAAGGVLEKQRPNLQFQLGHPLAVP